MVDEALIMGESITLVNVGIYVCVCICVSV